MEVRLLAANILARLGPVAGPALASMRAAIVRKDDGVKGKGKGKGARHEEYPLEVLRHAVEALGATRSGP